MTYDASDSFLMKRDDDRPRSKPHIERYARRLRKFQQTFDSPERDQHRSFNAIMAEAMAKADADRDGDDADIAKARDRHDVGGRGLAAATSELALDLIHHHRRRLGLVAKAGEQTEKDSTMDRTTELRDIAKAGGIVAVAKAIIDENRSYGITEHEFVALVTEHAKAAHPELTEAAGFAKLYEIPEIWRACNVLKSAAPYFDPQVQVVGGDDARDVNDPSAALAALHRIGRERWPDASEAIRFTRAFEANPELARKAHVRPSATTSYEFPR